MRGFRGALGILLLVVALAPMAMLPPGVRADTYVSGTIATDTTWDVVGSPYVVLGNVTVASGVNLTVEAGVTVRLDPGREIAVQGRLDAVGTASDPIIFTANATAPPIARWSSIRTAGGFVRLENTTVEYADRGLDVGYGPGGTAAGSEVWNSLLRLNGIGVSGLSPSNLVIEGNTFLTNTQGTVLWYPTGGRVRVNTFDANTESGIAIQGTQTNAADFRVEGNTVTGSLVGIDVGNVFAYTSGLAFTDNVLSSNSLYGMRLNGVRGLLVERNVFTANGAGGGAGLFAASAWGDPGAPSAFARCNEFTGNAVGERLQGASGVLSHLNNFLGNTVQAADDGNGSNAWDDGSAGNFWSDYGGVDADGDGIGDSPYTIGPGVVDNLPLMAPVDLAVACPPTAPGGPPVAVPGGPYIGGKNRPIAFDGSGSYDAGGVIVSYAWTFGDGGTGTGPTPTHAYTAAGVYTLTLTVTDDDGLTDMAATIVDIVDLPPLSPILLAVRLKGGAFQHVQLDWATSGDDGALDNDVVAYDLYLGSAYDPTGASYAFLDSVPAGTTTYTHVGGGGAGVAFYRLVARENTGRVTAAEDQGGKFSRFLAAGKQLVSVPLEQEDWSVGTVLQTVSWTRARTYVNPAGQGKNWLSNDNGKPWADLSSLDRRMAVWVQVTTAGDWVVAGIVPRTTTLSLETGWNFLGYASFTAKSVSQLLAGINYQTVEGYADDPPYNLRRLSPSDLMSRGNGYWVHVSQDALLTFMN